MAGELRVPYDTTGQTLYVRLWNTVGQVYNTATPAFEAYNAANYTDYDVALAEQGASKVYVGDMPAVAAGLYYWAAFLRAGGTPAESDGPVWDDRIDWDGSAVASLSAVATVVRRGTAQAGTVSTVTLDAGASATNNLYVGLWVRIKSGTGADQARYVKGYVGATKVATVAPDWAVSPDNTSAFVLLPAAGVDVEAINGADYNPSADLPIDLTQLIGDTQTDGTVGSALLGLEGDSRGKEVLDVTAKTWTKYRQDGTTVIDIFDLDNPSAPTVRVPR